MFKCSIIVVTILNFLVLVTCGPAEQYRGHQVVEMIAKDVATANLLRAYVDNHNKDMDVWTLTPTACQVSVVGEQVDPLQKFCEENNIDFKVMIEDLEVAITEHMKRDAPTAIRSLTRSAETDEWFSRPQQEQKPFNYEEYNRFDDIAKELYRLQCAYPDIVDVTQIGLSHEKRPLLLVRITQNVLGCSSKKKPVIWIDGGTHAREWISVATPMWILRELVTKFGKDDDVTNLLMENEIMLSPVFNPDGYEYTFTGARLWRKTRTPTKKTDCLGIDANRNWDTEQFGGAGTSDDPCSPIYPGEFPEQDPAVRGFAQVLRYIRPRLKTYWTMHSFSQFLLTPNSYKREKPPTFRIFGGPAFVFVTTIISKSNRVYGTGNAIDFQNNLLTGLSLDYVHDALQIPYSYLLELPPSRQSPFGFALQKTEIDSVSKEVFCSMLAALNRIDEDIAARQQAATTVPPTTTIQTTFTTTKTTNLTTTPATLPSVKISTTTLQTEKPNEENSTTAASLQKTPESKLFSTPQRENSGSLENTTTNNSGDNYRTSRRR
ncbi:carboxypeptidase B-like [Clytia hemisphaerica]|uniref:Peptidase M14 domain-containing protein n=1 Tax=Clytia hemisphaerica TaxID=252671 RepID=A0A7M6DMD7_9CNID